MVRSMKSAFRDNLDRLSWMSAKSKVSAQAKLDQMVDLIGYPEAILDPNFLDEMFEGFHVNKNASYLRNTVAYSKFARLSKMQLYFTNYNR